MSDIGLRRLDQVVISIAILRDLLGVASYVAIFFLFPGVAGGIFHISAIQIVVFGTFGVVLSIRGKKAPEKLLGIFFLLISNAYTFGLTNVASPRGSEWRDWTLAIANLRPDALIAWYFWRFLGVFPNDRFSFRERAFVRWARRIALWTGAVFVAIGAMRTWWYMTKYLSEELQSFVRLIRWDWDFLIPQIFVAALYLPFRRRFAVLGEHRRIKVFLTAFAFGLGGAMSIIMVEIVFPTFYESITQDPFHKLLVISTSNLFLLTIPFTTTYAVIAQKVLDVQLIARSAVQHLLARYSATVLGLAPFFFLVLFLFQNRHLTLEQLFTGNQAIVLAATTAVGLVFLRFRQPILDAIDRRFFRDRYNAKRVLTQLADQVRGTRNVRELSNMVVQGVDLALHLERVALLAQDQQLGRFVDPQDNLRPLDPGSRLATLMQGQREPLEVDLDSPSSPLQALDEQEKHWLVDGKIEMIAATYALDGGMIGLLALGGKKSELPFLKEDRDLLQSVCSATGLVLELMTLKEKTVPPRQSTPIPPSPSGTFPAHAIADPEEVARECAVCQRLYPPTEERCPNDDFELEPTLVPFVLRGQYRFEKRLGAGGMAVVYLTTDLRLGRAVAIKTLPRASPEAAMRLHREARTAATVNHPGLAGIYGIETWEGTPMLVLEYLPGGTLADQLTQGEPLDPLLAVDMGKTVALALQKVHGAGILHRDIKPSNIGYDEEGLAKLLDFGVARIQHDLRQEAETGPADEPLDSRSRVANTADWVIGRTATGQLVGTISYLSPEAVRGARPEPSFDLWALNVVLWESLTGKNLFGGRIFRKVLDAIRDVEVKPIRDYLPDCPAPVAEHFDRELGVDKSLRAASGRELHDRLVELERRLVD